MDTNYISNPGSLKIDLMLRGIRVDEGIEGVEGVKGRAGVGIDVVLPSSALVNVPFGEDFTKDSPYLLKRSGGDFLVTDGTGEVAVKVVPPPAFYGRVTTTGVPFKKIATVHGSYVVITPSPYCEFFNRDVECKYCAGNFDLVNIDGGKVVIYSVDEVLETA